MTDTIIITPSPAVEVTVTPATVTNNTPGTITVAATTAANIQVTSPIINTGTSTAPIIGINQTLLQLSQTQITNLVSDLAAKLDSTTASSTYLTQSNAASTYATPAFVGTAISNLVNSAPAVLDTLNELAAALGNDAAFATTVTNSLSGKASLATDNTFTNNTNTFVAGTGATKLIVKAGATQGSTNWQEWQNASGTPVARIDQYGGYRGTFASLITDSSTTPPLALRGASNQVADILTITNNSATTIGGHNANAQIYTGSTTPIFTAVGGTIQSIATGANPLITMASAHGLAIGDLVQIAGTTGNTYNGTNLYVSNVPSATTFNIISGLTVGQAGAAGTLSISAQASITQRSIGTIGLRVKGASTAGSGANLFDVVASDNSQRFSVNSFGNTAIGSGLQISGTTNNAPLNASLQINQGTGSTNKGIIVRSSGSVGVTANSIEIMDFANTVLGGTNGVGQTFTGSTTPVLTASGGTIQSIATGANPLVTMASAHGFTIGDLVTLAGTTGGTYNGTFVVATTPLTTTFTITSSLTTGQASAAGTVSVPAQKSITSRSAATIPLVIKGASGQTASLIEIRDGTNTLKSYTLSNGDWIMPNLYNSYAGVGTGYSDYQGTATSLYVRPTATTRIGVVIKGLTSQTANLQEWQTFDGTNTTTTVANITKDGVLNAAGISISGNGVFNYTQTFQNSSVIPLIAKNLGGSANIQEWQEANSGAPSKVNSIGQMRVRTYLGTYTNAALAAAAAYAAEIPIMVRGLGAAGTYTQTGDLQQWQTFDGTNATTVAKVDNVGNITGKSLTANNNGTLGYLQLIGGTYPSLTYYNSTSTPMTQWINTMSGTGGGSLFDFTATGGGFFTIRSAMNDDTKSTFKIDSSRNIGIGGMTANSFSPGAAASGTLFIANVLTAPTGNPTTGGTLYVDTGALKYRGTSGTAATIVNADGTDPNAYTLPTASTSVLGGVKVDGTSITINGSGVISGANTYTLPDSTASVKGGVITGSTLSIASGTINLPTIGTITPGAYTNSDITVDAQGRITLIANGTTGPSFTDYQSWTFIYR